jgi:GntR family transcriptional regulator
MTEEGLQPLKANKLSLSARAQQYLLRLVENGTYEPGEQLPSEADLAAQLGISRPTLREALLNLEQEGVIVRKHGVGTFVAPGYGHRLESGLERLESILALAARQGLAPDFADLEVEEVAADGEMAERLGITPGSAVTSVRRAIVVDKKPVAYMVDLVPAAILPAEEIGERFNGSVLDLLRERAEMEMGEVLADIVALNAGDVPHLAEKLKVKPGQAILLIEEVLYDVEGAIVEYSRNYFVPDFFRFHVVRR